MTAKRPLSDKRPVGPVIGSSDENEEQRTLSKREKNIVEQAENWYQSITEERVKRKMMINYIDGITDDSFSRSKARKIVKRAGL